MIITYARIRKITFPVFIVPKGHWEELDGLLLLNGTLVDDTNMSGKTLGIRRLQNTGRELCELRHSIYNHVGLIKRSSNTRYIDIKGVVFYYSKTRTCKINYMRISKLESKDGITTIMWVKGIKTPFTLIRPPEPGRDWAGIIYLGKFPWMVYDFSMDARPPIRKRV